VVAVAGHATGEVVLSAARDGGWALLDVGEGRVAAARPAGAHSGGGARGAAWHPDGHILALACDDGVVRVWDVRGAAPVAALGVVGSEDAAVAAGGGGVAAVACSENGYTLAAGDDGGAVALWDLRKQKKTAALAVGAPARAVAFDQSGSWVAAGGAGGELGVWAAKDGARTWGVAGHGGAVTGVRFGPLAAWLASSSMDRTLKVWAAPA
jgi:pre-mRNA-processing factor 19